MEESLSQDVKFEIYELALFEFEEEDEESDDKEAILLEGSRFCVLSDIAGPALELILESA